MPIPNVDGYVWTPEWSGFGEGAYTLLAKLAYANCLGITTVRRLGQTTLLDSGLKRPSSAIDSLVKSWGLKEQLGELFLPCASDERTRFCRSCMALGYHAAISQLSLLERCPIHNEPFIEACPHCAHPTPEFSLAKLNPAPTFACAECNRPFGDIDLIDKPIEWGEPKSEESIVAIHRWARAVQQTTDCPRWACWMACDPRSAAHGRRARLVALAHLRELPWRDCWGNVDVIFSDTFTKDRNAFSQDRVRSLPTYLQLMKDVLPDKARMELPTPGRGWARTAVGICVPVEPLVSVQQHATYLWRCQFENMVDDERRGAAAAMASHAFLWRAMNPLGARHWSIWNERGAMFGLATATWNAALRIASAWRAHLDSSDSIGVSRRFTVEIDRAWQRRLGRWDWSVASPVGIAAVDSAPGGTTSRVYFFVA